MFDVNLQRRSHCRQTNLNRWSGVEAQRDSLREEMEGKISARALNTGADFQKNRRRGASFESPFVNTGVMIRREERAKGEQCSSEKRKFFLLTV